MGTKADKISGRCTGQGIVNFMDQEGCAEAYNALNGLQMPTGAFLKARAWTPDNPAGMGQEDRPGDWTCEQCGAGPVYATRKDCFKCGAPNPNGPVVQEQRPGDWTCPQCGAGPVFATRKDCFKCGAPNPNGGHFQRERPG